MERKFDQIYLPEKHTDYLLKGDGIAIKRLRSGYLFIYTKNVCDSNIPYASFRSNAIHVLNDLTDLLYYV